MTKKTINLGSRENAGNGDPVRVAFTKIKICSRFNKPALSTDF